jgi:hypothetical protein
VRATLSAAFSAHPNPSARAALAKVAYATVLPAQYTLSELIAIQQRVASSIPGWTMAGTSIITNKVVVGFPDSAALSAALAELTRAGIPPAALTTMITPPVSATATYFESMVRPTRAGLVLSLQNNTYEPYDMVQKDGMWVPLYYGYTCSLGFNVQATGGTNYFMTAGHCANTWRGQNGVTGDTVFQPSRMNNFPASLMGTITVNRPWTAFPNCPTTDGFVYDFCTTSDVALGQYIPISSGERKVATSTTGGVNGYPGSSQINGYYSINAVLSPEYVNQSMHHELAKSGGVSYTTSGPFVSEMADVRYIISCWPQSFKWGCGQPAKLILLQNHGVFRAKISGGDSGGPVFTGNPGQGAPYAAVGIVVAGKIPNGTTPQQRCQTCEVVFSRWDMIQPRINLGVLRPETVF